MSIIKILDKHISDKIAAGEVIEEALSVVKELVENSIDAGSDFIVVEIKNGGNDYIRVTDNGRGMDREDALISFKDHATSKIVSENDLTKISSLGFRGEALASIAAVSKMDIITKTKDDKVGIKLSIEESNLISEEKIACDKGTTIVVKDLFFNMPARRKFIKAGNKEAAAISDFLSKMALAYSNIRFRFINNGTIIFSTQGKGDIYQTILTVYSPKDAKKLLKLDYNNGQYKLQGYISSPLESRNNRRQQIYFVNGRLIQSKLIDSAISLAYKDKLFEGRYPSVYLFISLNPVLTDVNIHPRKLEIKFLDEEGIKEFLIYSMRDAMLEKNTPSLENSDVKVVASTTYSSNSSEFNSVLFDEPLETKNTDDIFKNLRKAEKSTAEIIPITLEDVIKKQDIKTNSDIKVELSTAISVDKQASDNNINEIKTAVLSEDSEIFGNSNKTDNTEQQSVNTVNYIKNTFSDNSQISKVDRFIFSELTALAQVFDTYILATDYNNFYIIDQHAAHERIMYENFLSSFNSLDINRQILLIPIVLELNKSEMLLAESSIERLKKIGFVLNEFGPGSLICKEIPYFMDNTEAESFLYEYFNSTEDEKNNIQLKENEIISRSCKAAVKANDKLSLQEMNELFNKLDKCENPFSCPHGRPTFIKFTQYEIEKLFKRK